MISSFFSKYHFNLNEIDSTNNFLIKLNKLKKFKYPVVATADFQNMGKGRNKNSWQSQKGKNLLLSILFNHKVELNDQFKLNAIISLSIAELVSIYTDNKVYVKWPNDIIVCNNKIAGVIVENTVRKNIIKSSVIGIGVNINQKKFQKFNPDATSLSILNNKKYEIDEVKKRLLELIEINYKNFDPKFLIQYNNILFRKNKYTKFVTGENIFRAKIQSVQYDGSVIMKDETGKSKKFKVNDIKYLL